MLRGHLQFPTVPFQNQGKGTITQRNVAFQGNVTFPQGGTPLTLSVIFP